VTFDAFETPIKDWARSIRHIAEALAGGGDPAEAIDALWELAEEIDPGSGADLEAYVVEVSDDSGDDTATADPA